MKPKNFAKFTMLLLAFLIFFGTVSHATVTIRGKVVEVQGSKIKIKCSGEYVPNAGDPVDIGFKTGGDFIPVEGEWKIIKADRDFAWAEAKGSVSGKPAVDYLAIIHSPQANLLAATKTGDLGLVKSLVAAGANVNPTGEKDIPPLGLAASGGQIDIVRTLIKAGADIHWESSGGQTALGTAAYQGHANVVRTLIDAGVNVNAKIKSNKAPRNYQGATPLFLAIMGGNIETLRVLIDAGANVNERNKIGITPLMIATTLGKKGLGPLLLLIAEGADINAKNTTASAGPPVGSTALMGVAMMGNLKFLSALILGGADIAATNSEGRTALKYAKKQNNKKIIEILKKPEQSKEAAKQALGKELIYAVKKKQAEIVRLLIRLGVDINVKDEKGRTALIEAIENGSVENLRLLIKAGADINAPYGDFGGNPLMAAASKGNREVIRILIQAGVKINRKASGDQRGEGAGWTALMVAAMAGHSDAVSQLLKAGADTAIVNKAGKTAMDIAKKRGNKEVVRLLERR